MEPTFTISLSRPSLLLYQTLSSFVRIIGFSVRSMIFSQLCTFSFNAGDGKPCKNLSVCSVTYIPQQKMWSSLFFPFFNKKGQSRFPYDDRTFPTSLFCGKVDSPGCGRVAWVAGGCLVDLIMKMGRSRYAYKLISTLGTAHICKLNCFSIRLE